MLQTIPVKPLWEWLSEPADAGCSLHGPHASIALKSLVGGSSIEALPALRGRAVLVALQDQLSAALALIELDGLVRRLVLCPPCLSADHCAHVVAAAGIDTIVCDRDAHELACRGAARRVLGGSIIRPAEGMIRRDVDTEWIMLTSGTSGAPKLVSHRLTSLTGAIKPRVPSMAPIVWGTFYDIRRFGGLQILLRSILGGSSLVLSDATESMGRYLERAGSLGVTHISGTPSQWRNALAHVSSRAIAPRYIRLSGEIADQAILDGLRVRYPQAEVVHAFAATETGVGFEVEDGREGFPAGLIGRDAEVEIKLAEGSLRMRSARAASGYIDADTSPVSDADGFIDTGDLVELRGDRYYFVGRRGGIINVGGLKVHPEEVEAVINRHPLVRGSVVRARKNLITGAIVVADVVLRTEGRAAEAGAADIKQEILRACRQSLANYKVPAAVRFVESLDLGPTGKSARVSDGQCRQREGLMARPAGGAPDARHR